jgi:hypothetical protein
MGHLLNLPYNTESLPRCSNIWLFDILFLPDWNKIGDHRQHQSDLNTVKFAHTVTGATKLLAKYFLEKMVYSANQRVGMNVILGLHQFV